MSRNELMMEAAKRGKYAELFHLLSARQGDEWPVTFDQLETLLGFALPNSARIYRPWWANDNCSGHSQSMAWTLAGWKTAMVDMENEMLTFQRVKGDTAQTVAQPVLAGSIRDVAPTMNDFRGALGRLFKSAEANDLTSLVVNAGNLHRSVGGYPTPFNRMTMCCNAMYQEQRGGDEVIRRPNKGYGATLAIEYCLPRR